MLTVLTRIGSSGNSMSVRIRTTIKSTQRKAGSLGLSKWFSQTSSSDESGEAWNEPASSRGFFCLLWAVWQYILTQSWMGRPDSLCDNWLGVSITWNRSEHVCGLKFKWMNIVDKLEKPLKGERGHLLGLDFNVDTATFESDLKCHFSPSVILIPT